jgi:hypothetical protein
VYSYSPLRFRTRLPRRRGGETQRAQQRGTIVAIIDCALGPSRPRIWIEIESAIRGGEGRCYRGVVGEILVAVGVGV